ncbi:Auxin-induced protein X15 [Linum perenne]
MRRRRKRGYIGMYVGKEAQRYEVPVKWLGKPAVQELMRRSEDDVALLDYKIVGPMSISCSVESFDRVLFQVR